MPFLSPSGWRAMVLSVTGMSDRGAARRGAVRHGRRHGTAVRHQLKRRSTGFAMTGTDTSAAGEERWLLPEGIEELLPEQARARGAFAARAARSLWPLGLRAGDSAADGVHRFAADRARQRSRPADLHPDRSALRTPARHPPRHHAAGRAHRRPQPAPRRAGAAVLRGQRAAHARAARRFASRSPIQLGAELYGDASAAADLEVISLMLETMRRLGVRDVTLDLGHVGIFRALMQDLALDGAGAGRRVRGAAAQIGPRDRGDRRRCRPRRGARGPAAPAGGTERRAAR